MNSYDRFAESLRPDSRVWPFPDPATPEEPVFTEPDTHADIEQETITEFLSVAEHYLNA